MKKQIVLLAALLGGTLAGHAQKKGFDYKFYGQVRTDLFYNSRSNSETVDGLFYMYPLDEVKDPNGNDLNKNGNSDFYTLPLHPFGRRRDRTDVRQGKDFGKGGGGFPRLRHYVFALPHPPRVFQSRLGQVGIAGRTDLASALWRCGSRNIKPEHGRARKSAIGLLRRVSS